MKQRIISLLLAVLMTATILPVQAWGATVVASGTCGGEGDGSNLTWTLDSDGLLTIEGKGEMSNWNSGSSVPWYANRSKIKRVVIGSSVTSIGNQAFYSCSGLTSVTIPNSVTSIENSAFSGCSSLTSVTIGNSVTSISSLAFYDCSSLTSITIPDSVMSIEAQAFIACRSLTSIQVGPRNQNYCSVDGVLFDKSKATLIQYPVGKPDSHYTISNSVTSIENSAFSGCSSLTSVTIPNSVTSIGWSAFSSCSSLTSITIPDSVTSIGGEAFYNCSSLTSITIPDSVTSIGARHSITAAA